MNRICLVALIGLPAVGKTTFSKTLMELETLPCNILHICYDNYFKTIDMGTNHQYKEQREKLLKTLETIIQAFKTSKILTSSVPDLQCYYKNLKRNDLLIICDDNHYYRSMRYKLYQMSRLYNIGYGQIYFECAEELALKQNNLRTKTSRVPEEIFLQMSKRLEPPNKLKHTWEETTLVLTQKTLYDNKFLLQLVPFILKSLEVSVKPLKPTSEKLITSQSIVHDLDLLIRKRINHLISSNVETNKKVLAKELNGKRKDILEKFQLNINKKFDNTQDFDLNKYVKMLE